MSSERRVSDLRNLVSGLYTLGETIGTGHFAAVKLARHVFTQKEVAVKVIDKTKLDELSKAHLFQEVKCMKLVQHPNVVRLYEVIDTPNKLYLILELADGGDMYDYIMKHANGLNEILARRYFRQICRALKYCHEMRVCHRDLKPENLVFFEKQGVVKLTDFGFSNEFSPGTKLLTSCGSLAYSAPEILLGDPYDAPAVDIWSLGVVLFMLVTGRAPFQEANDSETVMMILDCCYKLPPNISSECQNLIHRMIIREPEKRATLDEVMCDIWYRQGEEDDDSESLRIISHDEHEFILHQMVNGNIAERDVILNALKEDQYNHITATYYLLVEKILHDKINNHDRNTKRQRRSLQPASDPFTEQIGAFLSSTSNVNFTDVSLPATRKNSFDEDFDDISGKENIPPISTTPRHSIDLSNDQPLSVVQFYSQLTERDPVRFQLYFDDVLIEDDEEQPSLQQRTNNTNTQATPAQAMKIILEEDEYPESPPSADKTDTTNQQLGNHAKLNKIVESEDKDDKSFTPNTNILTDNSTTTSSILYSKDLRSVIETKRRNFPRSCSSSDSEDNGSNYDINRLSNQKHPRSSHSFQESDSIITQRGRSLSNVEHVLNENLSNIQQQTISFNSNNNENIKRKSFSRTNSIISTNRLLINGVNDDINTDILGTNSFIFIPDRTRSLSNEHRLANPSQISFGSRTSIRYSTPRESTVFTKTDAPHVIRLIQQTQHQDTTDVIKTLIEYQRVQQQTSSSSYQEHSTTPIIVEEDTSLSLSNINIKNSIEKNFSNGTKKLNIIVPKIEHMNLGNNHISTSQHSVLSTLKHSLIKHQQHRKSNNENFTNKNQNIKHSINKQRTCCVIL